MRNANYWNTEGPQKVFTHPMCPEWLKEDLDRESSVLDLGCGYGRLTSDLRREGFRDIVGYDSSVPMIERATHENPGASYTSAINALADKSFDLVLCFALSTSCPSNDEHKELAVFINSHTRENARLYISDYETADNPHCRDRYEQRELNTYGCFKSTTAVFRHHEPGHFDDLLPGWLKLKERTLSSKTLHGHEITIHQYLYGKGMR
ncbi:class I SAM-dependent methyltransferase [Planctomycetota bacterium]